MIPLQFADKVVAFNVAGQGLPLAPGSLPKYVDRLPTLDVIDARSGPRWSVYEIQAMPTKVIPSSGMAAAVAAAGHTYPTDGTTFWSYRTAGTTSAVKGLGDTYLGPAFVVQKSNPIKIRWHNKLKDSSGNPIKHPLAVDPSLHWAAVPATDNMMEGSPPGTIGFPVDAAGASTFDYTLGTVPLVAHVHGGEQPPGSDGGPDGWITPDDKKGPSWNSVGDVQIPIAPSDYVATGDHDLNPYWNSQPAASTWYHDHALGLTRLNVYMGLASGYLVTDPAHEPSGLPAGSDSFGNPMDMALIVQDRMFDQYGELYFPALGLNPTEHPFWIPEFFGDTMLVNGQVWPVLDVDPAAYRFRLFNGSNARFYELSLLNKAAKKAGPAFNQIATDGGYLYRPVKLNDPALVDAKLPYPALTIAPGERAEIVVDFSAYAGQSLILRNKAKAPFPMGAPATSGPTGEVMMVRVKQATPKPYAFPTNPLNPQLQSFATTGVPTLGTAPSTNPKPVGKVRTLTLNEYMGLGGPLEVLLNLTKWMAPISEDPKLGATEIWKIVNTTADTHPIHLHLVQFQLVSRQAFNTSKYAKAFAAVNGMMPFDGMMANDSGNKAYQEVDPTPYLQGPVKLADANERGWKDTVRMNPGEVTTIVARFATIDPFLVDPTEREYPFPFDATVEPGYVWHCHIVDHEDNEMMRPYTVKKP